MINTFDNLKLSWKYAYGYRRYLILYIIFGLIVTVCNVLEPLLIAKMIVEITDQNVNNLFFVGFLIFVLALISVFFWLCSRYVSGKFSKGLLVKLQCILVSETLSLSQKELLTNSSGVFADRINNDCKNIRSVFLELSYTFISSLANVGVMVAVFFVNKYVFCYYVVVVILIDFFNHLRYKFYFKIDKQFREINEMNTGIVSELIRGLKDIKVLNAESGFIRKLEERFTSSGDLRFNLVKKDSCLGAVIDVFKSIMKFGFVVLSVVLIKNDLLTFASFIVLFTYQSKVFSLLDNVNYIIQYMKDYNLSCDRIFDIILHKKFEREEFGLLNLDCVSGNFEFKDVCFGYDDLKVLDGVSFKIKENETVAFVGKSGSGKSTIFNLITKLYESDSGEILVDGVDIKSLNCESIRGNISLITQDPYIFNFSIRENLALVKDDMTDDEMVEACKMAQIHDYIMTLPDKYDTLVGEGGVVLSGGQRQRLAIARALIKKTEIILFDEATSALDNETQRGIQMAINNMKGKYTVLIIAHRLSTVVNSDRILFVSSGKIIDSGTHDELMGRCLEYKNLYENEFC